MVSLHRLIELLDYDASTGTFTWRVRRGGRAQKGTVAGRISKGHRYILIDRRNYAAHRLVWLYFHGKWPQYEIDHLNGDRDDNRISNLRDVPRAVNAENMRRARTDNKSSGLLGVTAQRGRWIAQITVRGRNHNLGSFDTPQKAHAAYVAAKRRLHVGCTI
jgi:hypothetical protein